MSSRRDLGPNPDSLTNAQGEFHASKPRDKPLETKGHQPGVLTGNDAVPTFQAKTLPPGTAPAESTYKPNPISETPGQADNDAVLASQGDDGEEKESTFTSATETLGGATSGDVHTGYGHPGQGQTAADKNHGQRSGLAGVGASGAASLSSVDPNTQPSQRGLDKEGAAIAGRKDNEPLGAEERLPESSEAVAAERD